MSHTPASLALCASGATFSVAVRAATGAIDELSVDGRRQIAELMLLLDRLLARFDLVAADIGELRVDRGPGSYTGLRMALTFARVLAAFGSIRLRATTSLELLALAAWQRAGVPLQRAVRPILDARRGRAYTARAQQIDGRVRLTQAPVATPVERLADLVCDDETVVLDPTHRAWLPAAATAVAPPPFSARDLFHPALLAEQVDVETLEPLYLMGTYAE